ncbi:MAG: sulfatase [Verrucomicrobiae bacterium]|nr:sulfatase [Verrucomicrobiae bacterium]
MKRVLIFTLAFCFVSLAVCRPTFAATTRPNVLFIAIDDLRNDLGALGAAHARTPQLDAFAKTARLFSHHFVQVPTCGASRCALWRGRYPTLPAHVGNNGIRDTQAEWAGRSLPALFRQNGYRTLALGKLTHHPGGRTGKDWGEGPEELPGVWDRSWIPDGPWKTPLAIMHGYANGVARQSGQSPPWEAHDGPDESYPDAWIAAEAIKTLKELAAQPQPWFFGVGFFKPHLPFAAPKRWHDLHAAGVTELKPEAAARPSWPSGWHGSGEFRGNYGHAGRDPQTDPDYARLLRRAYAASVSYMDAQVGRVLTALRETGLEDNTIVVVWSDHGFLLGEHAIWGKHALYEHALRSPLLIRHPGLAQPGKTSTAIVETVDLFPTLAELCRLPLPSELDGHSLWPQLRDPLVPSRKPAHGFWTGGQRTLRTDRWRLIVQPGKEGNAPRVELFDYLTDAYETRNHAAEQPETVRDLMARLDAIPLPASFTPRPNAPAAP